MTCAPRGARTHTIDGFGPWRSSVSALVWGTRGREFESPRPDEMFKTIVVGTDGSDPANAAVRHAADLARAFGASLHLVGAYRSASSSAAMASVDVDVVPFETQALLDADQAIAATARRRLDDAAAAVGVEASVHVADGDPAEVILDVAERVGADLVVVGSRGMSGLKRLFLGSVSSRVSHGAHASVLIVHTAS